MVLSKSEALRRQLRSERLAVWASDNGFKVEDEELARQHKGSYMAHILLYYLFALFMLFFIFVMAWHDHQLLRHCIDYGLKSTNLDTATSVCKSALGPTLNLGVFG